ncbi:DUF806 family protein [Ligilactobacillus cholophilus]|uniref:DUF806 family protein n=1 Tax=Ligilactobacillus cholophilus TaxID=3050131 RepID=UPI0025B0D027|nr:DUF806 family protein [Ligilactobacillus cholophilus]
MSAITDVEEIIKTNVPQIDKVFTYLIPKAEVSNTSETVALIREVQVQTDEEGNNTFNAISTQLQIQIFLKLDVDFDIEDLQIKLLKLFNNNIYECYSFGGWYADPDTQQLSNSFYIEKLKYVN